MNSPKYTLPSAKVKVMVQKPEVELMGRTSDPFPETEYW